MFSPDGTLISASASPHCGDTLENVEDFVLINCTCISACCTIKLHCWLGFCVFFVAARFDFFVVLWSQIWYFQVSSWCNRHGWWVFNTKSQAKPLQSGRRTVWKDTVSARACMLTCVCVCVCPSVCLFVRVYVHVKLQAAVSRTERAGWRGLEFGDNHDRLAAVSLGESVSHSETLHLYWPDYTKYTQARKLSNFKTMHRCSSYNKKNTYTNSLQIEDSFIGLSQFNVQ